MRRLALAVLLTTLACAAQTAPPQTDSPGQPQATSPTAEAKIVVPAGTAVSLALTSPILAKTAKAGDSVYAQTAFPVAVNDQMAIPAGTYAQGQIDALTRPGWLSPHAQLQIHFTKLIFVNGYTVEFRGTRDATAGLAAAQQPTGTPRAGSNDVIAAVANAYVDVSSASDVLLDNGSQLDMVLQVPLRLNAASVAAAVRQSSPTMPGPFRSATLCRPTPGMPGTPDTVMPGSPGTPGTPDIVIPGAPGMPDTVIPGTPGTPGTPDTVIPGTPGTPGVACPGPPVVTPNPKVQSYKESFQISAPVRVSGTQLAAGSYQVTWEGMGPMAQVEILQNGKVVASVRARVVLLTAKSAADVPGTRANSDGSVSLQSLRFAGQAIALYFDRGST
ncbi:MAG TPA: hypothetical protein VLY23_00070 [Candidatus Acidoferrum sp.]|nr:hypothetical protein [Candidatus Acidoferrum sp.]